MSQAAKEILQQAWVARQVDMSTSPQFGQWEVVTADGECVVAQLWLLDEETHLAYAHADLEEDTCKALSHAISAVPDLVAAAQSMKDSAMQHYMPGKVVVFESDLVQLFAALAKARGADA